jgi:type IV pilus assembly protein PilC
MAQGAIVLYLLLLLLGWIPWHPPLVRRLSWRLDSATILRMLALSVEAGQPLSAPLASLARWYPRRLIRKKLVRVERDVSEGQVWCESLFRRGLLDRVDLAVLESAGRAGNLTWALREMADGCERRLGYRMQAWAQILFPMAVLLVAVPIGLTAVAFFLPIVEILKAHA